MVSVTEIGRIWWSPIRKLMAVCSTNIWKSKSRLPASDEKREPTNLTVYDLFYILAPIVENSKVSHVRKLILHVDRFIPQRKTKKNYLFD